MTKESSKIDTSVIRIGIDLGTTNSEIAVNRNGEIEIVKNLLGVDYTPSVFGIDKAGNKVVGKKAYDKLFKGSSQDELDNNKAEVKRLMGTNEQTNFPRLGKSMSPEEISAEILKSLKADLTRKYPDFPVLAAVITVPAYFDSLQNEATKRAGKLAGFKHVVLLQEPIAAAMAYGFSADKNQTWIVYDLGGGTFDVALVSANNGVLKVVEHGGDNFLGGKDIDQNLVDRVIKPAILRNFTLTDFSASNKKYRGVFAKLKAIAETAKIELSSYDKTTIEVDEVGNDDNGKEIYVSIDYTRAEFNNLIKPIVDKTIDVTKNVIKQSHISKSSISRVVFVGGPTQIPYIRQRVSDDLSIDVDTSVDPLTTVAQGACVYGLSERIPVDLAEDADGVKDAVKLTLNYDSMTSDDDQLVTGTFEKLPDNSQYYVRISSDSGFYSSNDIKIKNGKFFDTVAVEHGKTNTYWIYLLDSDGNNIPVFPESFTITHGLSVHGAPIPHDIGVIYAKKDLINGSQMIEVCDKFFERGLVLPLEATHSYKTVRTLSKGTSTPLPIKVYEGDSSNPNYNEIITTLKIDGGRLEYDLPGGSDIDITIKINESREVSVDAYLPDIDLLLNARADTYAQVIDTDKLQESLDEQKERAERLMSSVDAEEKRTIRDDILSIQNNISNTNDIDSQQKAERDLNSLSQRLDKIEGDKSATGLAQDIKQIIQSISKMLGQIDNKTDNYDSLVQEFNDIKHDADEAIASNDDVALRHVANQASNLRIRIAMESPGFWIAMLREIEENRYTILDQQLANYHIDKAREAIIKNDVDELKRHVQELIRIMPDEAQDRVNSNLAGITK